MHFGTLFHRCGIWHVIQGRTVPASLSSSNDSESGFRTANVALGDNSGSACANAAYLWFVFDRSGCRFLLRS